MGVTRVLMIDFSALVFNTFDVSVEIYIAKLQRSRNGYIIGDILSQTIYRPEIFFESR